MTESTYASPGLFVIGRLSEITLGGPHSNCDGNSGTVGNNGQGNDPCKF